METNKQTLTAMGCGNNLGRIDALRAELIKVLDLSKEQLQKLNLTEKAARRRMNLVLAYF